MAEIIRSEMKDACNIPDDEFIHYILDGLGSAYNAFVKHYRYGNETPNLAALKIRLLNVEKTVQQQDGAMGETAKALQAAHRYKPQPGRNYRGKQGSQPNRNKRVCRSRGKPGHVIARCPFKHSNDYKRGNGKPSSSQAFVTMLRSSVKLQPFG